jgi:hypothetical protein
MDGFAVAKVRDQKKIKTFKPPLLNSLKSPLGMKMESYLYFLTLRFALVEPLKHYSVTPANRRNVAAKSMPLPTRF